MNISTLMFQELLNRQTYCRAPPIVMRNKVRSCQDLIKKFGHSMTLEGHAGCVNSVLFSEDGTLAITGEC